MGTQLEYFIMFSPGPLFRNNESPFQMEWLRAVLAEFGGTFFITFLPTLALTAVFRDSTMTFGPFSLATANALVFTLTLIPLVAALGHISGAHVNPAVTLAMMVVREIPLLKGVLYIIAQFLGGIGASLAVYGILGDSGYEAGLGRNTAVTSIGDGEALFAELIVTAFFVFVIVATAVDKQYSLDFKTQANAPLAIGAALGAGHFALTWITGASMNPARSLGPWLVSEDFTRAWWAILIGPFLGGLIGALSYVIIFFDTRGEDELIDVYGSKNEDRDSTKTVIAGRAVEFYSTYSSDSYYDF